MTDTDGDLGDGANQNPGDSDGSNIGAELKTSLEALVTRLDVVESGQKALQGDKDRDVNKVRKESKELKEEFATFKAYDEKYGDDAEQRLKQDLMLQRLSGQLTRLEEAEKTAAEAQQKESLNEVDPELLKKYEVDPQSAEYLAQVKAGLTGYDAVMATALGAKPPVQKEGDTTGASGGAGGSGSVTTAQAVLKDQKEKALDKAQEEFGFLTPTQLQTIDDEFAKKGLE
jgi:hypothetical protein